MPAHPRVVNVKAAGGLPRGVVYVGRANPAYRLGRSRFANPYRPAKDGDRREMLHRYAQRLAGRPALLDAARHELKDRRLACWCVPAPCHASVLAYVADGLDPDEAVAETLAGEAEQGSLL